MSTTETIHQQAIRVGEQLLVEETERLNKAYEALVRISLFPGLSDVEKVKLDLLIKQYNYLLICTIHARSMT